jgi:hypothetical protein
LSAEPALRYRTGWLGIGVGLIALVVFLSLTSNPVEAPSFGGVKLGHVLAYLTLMFWFSQLFRSWPARLWFAAGFTLMGVGLEYVQGLTNYRSFGYDDMRDNAIGVVIGLAMGRTPLGMGLARIERWMGA